jgi:hypothetical protein
VVQGPKIIEGGNGLWLAKYESPFREIVIKMKIRWLEEDMVMVDLSLLSMRKIVRNQERRRGEITIVQLLKQS